MTGSGPSCYLKLGTIVFLVAAYIAVSLPLFPVIFLSPFKYRQANAFLVSFFSKQLLSVLGFQIDFQSRHPRLKGNFFIAANHLSYLDVLVLSAYFPGCFVTSMEIRHTPFLGNLTLLAGCLFVERRSREFLDMETGNISLALRNGLSVIIFPEGTSTNGDRVRRFRQPLFQAAVEAGVSILPVSISYTRINGAPVTALNRDRLFWYADMTFARHFTGLGGIHDAAAVLHAGTPIPPCPVKGCAGLSADAHAVVQENYIPVSTADPALSCAQ